MKNIIVLIFTFCFTTSVFAEDYTPVDEYSRSVVKLSDYRQMAIKLTAPFEKDDEKVRSIFVWISNNIKYDVDKLLNQSGSYTRIYGRNKKEIEQKKEKIKQNKINAAYSFEKGVCEDYCYLFEAMCDVAGIKSVFIAGNGKQFPSPTGFSSTNYISHSWNAVLIDNKWKLVDVTWAAGIIDIQTRKFVQKFQPAFFFTDPSVFVLNHFPDENKWQLLLNPITKQEFDNYPFIYDGYYDFSVKSIPLNSVLSSSKPYAILDFYFYDKIPELSGYQDGKIFKIDKIINENKVTIKLPTGNKHNKRILIGVLNGNRFEPITEYVVR